jgi:putative membrane protein
MSRNAGVIGIVIGLALIVLIAAGVALSGWGRGYGWGMMGPGMMGGGWGMPFLGPIFGMVLVGLIIGGVVWFVQSLSRGEPRPGGGGTVGETPLEILKRRYASGEVTKEQFEDMRRTLGS